MGLRPTQGDEKLPLPSNRSPWKLRPPLCHPDLDLKQTCHPDRSVAQWRDLLSNSTGINRKWKSRPPLSHPERSRGICSSADLSWKCFLTERILNSELDRTRRTGGRWRLAQWAQKPSRLNRELSPYVLPASPCLPFSFDIAESRQSSKAGCHRIVGVSS
jgi:hypothetical protein